MTIGNIVSTNLSVAADIVQSLYLLVINDPIWSGFWWDFNVATNSSW